MKHKIIFFLVLIFAGFTTIAQQLPWGSCGIVYIYDETGSRKRRLYFCNNGPAYPERQGAVGSNFKQPEKPLFETGKETMEFQEVDALYPNPTTGVFFITFSKALQDAAISITDLNGKVVQQFKASGIKLSCNLSSLAAGTYFVRIEEAGKVISKKVIKQ